MTDQPIHIFHHIPKCGGTSVRYLLGQWFQIIEDYRKGWSMEYPEKVNLAAMQPHQCLCGHFELDGYHLYQRYPEVFTSDRYRVFTFVRDPLQVRLSLFKYSTSNGVPMHKSIEDALSDNTRFNFLARRFPVTMENYQSVLDKYFFIGIIEHGQDSMDILAAKLGKQPLPLPWENRTRQHTERMLTKESLPQELIEKFKHDHALDYMIYDYCLDKFRKEMANPTT
ncbi:MAG: hypothetical protein AB1513_01225 [Pseudomonadota bacterium]